MHLYVQLQGETTYMSTTGLYDVDYKILVATRTGRLYIFSKSSTSGFKVETTHAIVAIILRIDKFICCTIDGLLQCYTLKVNSYLILYYKSYRCSYLIQLSVIRIFTYIYLIYLY